MDYLGVAMEKLSINILWNIHAIVINFNLWGFADKRETR
jgi:hypothetical protein